MTVALADDTVLFREGIARLLSDSGFDIVAQSGDPDDLLRHVAMHKPSVAIVDIRMPPTHTDEGIRAAREIRERFPATSVLVLSQYVEAAYAMDLFAESTEGLGYLLKDRVADVEEFAHAVRRVADGGSALDPAVVGQLLGRSRAARPAGAAHGARARGARVHGRGTLEPGHRRPHVRDAPGGREARDEHLREARPAGDDGRPPPRPGRARLPAGLSERGAGNRTRRHLVAAPRAAPGRAILGRHCIRPRKGSEMSPLRHSTNVAARMGRWSAKHRKTAIFGWLAFVVASFAIGTAIGMQTIDQNDSNVGEARRADHIIRDGGFSLDEQSEYVLVQSPTADGRAIPRSAQSSPTRSQPSSASPR